MDSMREIGDYALIGDLQSAALIGRDGSIDWCCLPRFDSGACFTALLGEPDHGRWLLAPVAEFVRAERHYRGLSLVLDSVYETAHGAVRVTDFMPPRDDAPDIVRLVEGIHGEVSMRSELIVRFDYGHIVPWVRRVDHTRLALAGPDALALRTPAELHGEGLTTVSEFTIRAGERVPFVLTWFPSHDPIPPAIDPDSALTDTERFWRDWEDECTHDGPRRQEIHDSLLVLKALTHEPTGGIVAAPTTSLPEWIGGGRNWDYRYCWLRDASLTITAMLNGGYRNEAAAWWEWLLRAVAGDPSAVQIMYGVAGERRLDERELDWLPGFAGSRPVRVGNGAASQLQIDIAGEVLEAAYETLCNGIEGSGYGWSLLKHLLGWLEHAWQERDAGIWEIRGEPRHFTHSKVMSWVAFDRAVRICEEFGRDGPVERWRELRDEVRSDILAQGWSETKGAYTQSYDSDELDASILLMPIVGFLPADDPRFVSTVEAVRRELSVDGLLLRYRTGTGIDGLSGPEGAFLPCSFWLVEVLALQGRDDEARELFDRLLSLRNDVGLLSEEYDPKANRMLGNFPQAFTHLALVEAALTLAEHRPMRHGGLAERETAEPVAPG
jgi:GH15 family glucan-1,4-alpha-glucosidase